MEQRPEKFWENLEGHGASPALLFDDGVSVSYAELHSLAQRLGAQMDPGWKLVALQMAPSALSIAALLACLRAGIAVVLLPRQGGRELDNARRRFLPDAVFRQVGEMWRFQEEMPRSSSPVHPDLAIIIVTSGSTGEGKAVRISWQALAANAGQIAGGLRLERADRALLTLPLHYAYGLSVLLSHLSVGASTYLPRRSVLDEGFIEAAMRVSPTNLPGVPFTFELLERNGLERRLPGTIRFITVAGGRMEAESVAGWAGRMAKAGGSFFVMYGASEATARMSMVDVTRVPGAERTIGSPVSGGHFELIDSEGSAIKGANVAGELCYTGSNVMMGYATCREDLAKGRLSSKLATGDIAIRRDDGLYEITGRKSRFSKIAGIRLNHDAIEVAMAKRQIHCAVIGTDNKITVFHDHGRSDDVLSAAAEVTGLGRTRLKAMRLDEIPRLPSGKIDYVALGAGGERPSPADRGVEAVFADSFFPHRVTPDDTFAGLGGDSLKHVEISLGLERCLKHIPVGWETLPVTRLATLQAEPQGGSSRLSTELLIRALAIFMVVLQHATLWPVPGGAAAMTVLLGFAMARFQLPLLAQGRFRLFFRPLLRTLIPYFLLVGGYALAWGQVPWASLFLVGNLGIADPARHTMLPYLYWFVEAFFQVLLVVAGLFTLPSVRKLGGEAPFRLGLYMLLAALTLRFLSPYVWDIGNRKLFTLPWIMPLAAFGWCAAHADTGRRRTILLALALLAMPLFAWQGGNWAGSWFKYTMQFAVIAALAMAPFTPVPAWLRRPTLVVAHASFHIYLFHRFVPEVVLPNYESAWPHSVFVTISVVGGIALGIGSSYIQGVLVRLFRRRLNSHDFGLIGLRRRPWKKVLQLRYT